jgi:hypothetical protein
LLVFVEAGPFANEHDLGVRVALAGYRARSRLAQLAARTDADVGADQLE